MNSRRLFAAEGSIHLYSSPPTTLTPADLYVAREHSAFRQAIEGCNLYVVAARPRILIDPADFSVDRKVALSGHFIVQRQEGVTQVPFRCEFTPEDAGGAEPIEAIGIVPSGTHVVLVTATRRTMLASHVVVAMAQSALTDEDRDLEVLYVGQSIGRSSKRTALDRLLQHSTLQRILAEATTYQPNQEIILLLYRFEHGRIFASTGGDLNAEPTATSEEELVHLDRMHNIKLDRRAIVSLAEAALIRHFQPYFNVQIKGNDFTARSKIKVLERLLMQDMTGLMVEISSANIQSRLRTASAPPLDLTELFEPSALNGSALESSEMKQQWAEELHLMAHTQFAQFPLTNAQERDTFLHGMIWRGETQRQSFFR
ncbi:hypothetical protein [Ralstonia solanacearum]|uniref:hypothetical protein n=1 Tax=Ralstonia solanacearum TaxID=305 RepID=UPI0012D742F9|nr:hypothetical protein [Ralstonia solanacearum]